VTVKEVVPEMLPDAAVIVVCPVATEVASPLEPEALLMVAMAVSDELQVTEAVRFCVVLSVYVPVAINCCVVPRAMFGFVGVTAMDTSVAEVTVKEVVPEMLPDAAVIVVCPVATEVASPLEPEALLMVAMAVFEESQVTDLVISRVVLSEYIPVAVNCWVVPLAILGFVGITAMEVSVPPLGESCTLPLLPVPSPEHDERANPNDISNIIKNDIFFMDFS